MLLLNGIIKTVSSNFLTQTKEYSVFIFPYSVQMRENKHQNNSEYGHFSRR